LHNIISICPDKEDRLLAYGLDVLNRRHHRRVSSWDVLSCWVVIIAWSGEDEGVVALDVILVVSEGYSGLALLTQHLEELNS
jgi:hypothetical protein